jgi:glycerate dehydrogenase
MTHLKEYSNFINNGEYQKSASANKLTPVYHELNGLTWGIIGFGNIGKAVGKVATAFGCNLLVNKQTPIEGYECVDVDTLIEKSDIITIHCPLTDKTRNIIDKKRLEKAKKTTIIINVARGGVWDENAVTDAILEGKIGGIGCDVFSTEPMSETHPFNKLLSCDNVILTPHMAWGAYEARKRCFDIVIENIKAFLNGEIKNRV